MSKAMIYGRECHNKEVDVTKFGVYIYIYIYIDWLWVYHTIMVLHKDHGQPPNRSIFFLVELLY